MKKMSKPLYVGIYAASLVLFVLLEIGLLVLLLSGVFRGEEKILDVIIGVMVLAALQFMLVSVIYTFLMLAKMWGAIQDGQTPVTVGKAIGFLFIPFFNLYWIFRVWSGFPAEYNRYVERYGLGVPRLGAAVYVTYPILLLLMQLFTGAAILVPFFYLLMVLSAGVVYTVLIAKTCNAVNALSAAVSERRGQTASAQNFHPERFSFQPPN